MWLRCMTFWDFLWFQWLTHYILSPQNSHKNMFLKHVYWKIMKNMYIHTMCIYTEYSNHTNFQQDIAVASCKTDDYVFLHHFGSLRCKFAKTPSISVVDLWLGRREVIGTSSCSFTASTAWHCGPFSASCWWRCGQMCMRHAAMRNVMIPPGSRFMPASQKNRQNFQKLWKGLLTVTQKTWAVWHERPLALWPRCCPIISPCRTPKSLRSWGSCKMFAMENLWSWHRTPQGRR